MNRVLALQGMTASALDYTVFADSNQSLICSSESAGDVCSSFSIGCKPTALTPMAW